MNSISNFLLHNRGNYCAQKFEIKERDRDIFAACKGQRMRKRVRVNRTPSSGSIICSVRTGKYTSVICKHKM